MSASCRIACLAQKVPGGVHAAFSIVIRQDGCWAWLHNDAYLARSACADSAYDQGEPQ
ncbi:hypothetical protein [Streptomyces sp. WMMC940]|uniref:hypothetical protein n=1 Tax=Streptomyces sp. WMMC940 TaxID=3015153 RepID=UPI0022B74D47|nr:hypothetical protein [Streptomyces sp. WMMC940]MCZ7460651.1 hypothetical protein [Streptomyces sp. WMMC940]